MQTHTTNIWKKNKNKNKNKKTNLGLPNEIYIYIYMAFFTTLGEGSKHRYNTVKIYNNQY